MAEERQIMIPQWNLDMIEISIKGTTPLITHAWSEKAKRQIQDKQGKKASMGREAKDPKAEFQAARYVHAEGWDAIPAVSFKNAAVRAATDAGMKMTDARRAFQVHGVTDPEWVKIEADAPIMREDMVRVGNGAADIRYRPQYWPWGVTLRVRYNPTAVSAEQIVNLFRIAGFGVGVAEWRPTCNGSFGMFEVL